MEKRNFKVNASLLSMLGDKLIENSIVAVTELIKNSYDADASKVIISFNDFGKLRDKLVQTSESSITISDDGHGMNLDVIENHFLNIATNHKDISKDGDLRKSPAGRVYLGAYGIGRFALLKLGKTITVYTKCKDSKIVYKVVWEFSSIINDIKNGIKQMSLFDVPITIESSESFFNDKEIERTINTSGTIIRIASLNDDWSVNKAQDVSEAINILTPINFTDNKEINGFDVHVKRDNEVFQIYDSADVPEDINEQYLNRLRGLIDNFAVYKISDGQYNSKNNIISFSFQEKTKDVEHISFQLKDCEGYATWREFSKKYSLDFDSINCGSFRFNTFIFNLDPKRVFEDIDPISQADRKFIEKHNIYLYRDNARILPYGNSGIDWLGIEKLRSETRAGDFFSQKQLVGQIFVTRNDNPSLQDKTSREGLIESPQFKELTFIFRSILEYIKVTKFDIKKLISEAKKKIDEQRSDAVSAEIKLAVAKYENLADVSASLSSINNKYIAEKKVLKEQVDVVEELAGVGMSIDISHHELFSTMRRLQKKTDKLIRSLNTPNLLFNIEESKEICEDVKTLQSFAMTQIDNLSKMMVSSRQRVKPIIIKNELEKIFTTYKETLKEDDITFSFIDTRHAFTIEAIDAVIYQTFSNLIDNAIYWLNTNGVKNKKIVVQFNRDDSITFGDTGPGVASELIPCDIFDRFVSGKGLKGRGLGLYISKRLLNKYEFDIRLANGTEKITGCNGANFVIEFAKRQ